MMDFAAIRTQAMELLQREGHVAYRVLQLQLVDGLKDAILLPVWKLAWTTCHNFARKKQCRRYPYHIPPF
jgi:hypothetical protein